MPDYKSMYYILLRAQLTIMGILEEAQEATENEFMDIEDLALQDNKNYYGDNENKPAE